MPLYDFRCEDCGTFEKWRTLAEIEQPVHCPTCEKISKRIFSPPMLLTSGRLRLNHDLNPEPQLIKRASEPKPQRNYEHRHGRPWMISH